MTTLRRSANLPFRVVVKLTSWLLIPFLCCSVSLGQKVKVKYLPESDFSKYHTYKWQELSHSGLAGKVNEDVDQDVQRAVDVAMSKNGFTKTEDSGTADLLLVAQTAVRQDHQWAGLDPHIPASSALIDNPGDMTIEVGTVVVDVYDSSRRQLLWHGRARKTFDEHDDLDTIHKSIKKGLTKLMKKFPPKR